MQMYCKKRIQHNNIVFILTIVKIFSFPQNEFCADLLFNQDFHAKQKPLHCKKYRMQSNLRRRQQQADRQIKMLRKNTEIE